MVITSYIATTQNCFFNSVLHIQFWKLWRVGKLYMLNSKVLIIERRGQCFWCMKTLACMTALPRWTLWLGLARKQFVGRVSVDVP
jgi:hypothetical protein